VPGSVKILIEMLENRPRTIHKNVVVRWPVSVGEFAVKKSDL
jgi:hypothetical protein